WDPERKRWVIRSGTMTALKKARPQLDLEKSGITLLDAALAGAAVVGAAAITADINEEVQRKKEDSSWCELDDILDPCDILDCSLSSADFGNCVPDCDFDCGGLDCSL